MAESDGPGADDPGTDDPGTDDPTSEGSAAEAERTAVQDAAADRRYKRRIGMLLAVLALVGAWIAVLQTNAATNEARAAREATRLAADAQRAQVVEQGAESGFEEIGSQIASLPERRVFQPVDALAEDVGDPAGASLDPDRAADRLEAAEDLVNDSLGPEVGRMRAVREEARRTSLLQAAVVEERVTWNARASQYETVITTLGVAIFLIGFTLVVNRRLRPPIVVPGLILALYCFGWSTHIYLKAIPDVDRDAISAVATGDVALDEARPADASAEFDRALELDDDYPPAHEGSALARLLAANPDLFRTVAITDASPEVIDDASAEIERALELSDEASVETLTGAAVVALVATDWDRAAEVLDEAIEANPLTPSLQLWRIVVAAAQGEGDEATDMANELFGEFADLRATDTARNLLAQFFSLLEWAEANGAPAEVIDDLRTEAVALTATTAAGRDLGDAPSDDVGFGVIRAEYSPDDLATDVAFEISGVGSDDVITVAGYERPAPGASWIQAPELYYVGPPGAGGAGSGMSIPTVRACRAVEYRFDFYVEGEFITSDTAPGGDPTC